MGAGEIETFLSHLASVEKVAAAAQRQALNAIVFLDKHVLNIDIADTISPSRAKRRQRVPVVMTVRETRRVLNMMHGQHLLMAELLFGAGLRRMECPRLRVNAIDTEQHLLYVRFGKGGKDRVLPMPNTLHAKLSAQIEAVKRFQAMDLAEGFGEAWLPGRFARKIGSAAKDLGWQYLFPSKKRSVDPRSGIERRQPRARIRSAKSAASGR